EIRYDGAANREESCKNYIRELYPRSARGFPPFREQESQRAYNCRHVVCSECWVQRAGFPHEASRCHGGLRGGVTGGGPKDSKQSARANDSVEHYMRQSYAGIWIAVREAKKCGRYQSGAREGSSEPSFCWRNPRVQTDHRAGPKCGSQDRG